MPNDRHPPCPTVPPAIGGVFGPHGQTASDAIVNGKLRIR